MEQLILNASGPVVTGLLVYFVVWFRFREMLMAQQMNMNRAIDNLQNHSDRLERELESVTRARDTAWKTLYHVEGFARGLCDTLNIQVVGEYEGDGTRPTMFADPSFDDRDAEE